MILSTVLKFSIIVPLIPQHDREMLRLFRYLKLKEDFIQEVIICRSETPTYMATFIKKKYLCCAKQLNFKPKVLVSSVPFRAYDGTNRNRGLKLATSDFVVFLDADDLYADSMFEIISKAFVDTNCHAILHDYTLDTKDFELINSSKVVTYELDFPGSASLLDFNEPIIKKGTSFLPNLHHAHLSIRTGSLVEQYLDIFPGADTEYCKRIIRGGKKVIFIDAKLSFWNRNRSFRYKIRLGRNKLRSKLGL